MALLALALVALGTPAQAAARPLVINETTTSQEVYCGVPGTFVTTERAVIVDRRPAGPGALPTGVAAYSVKRTFTSKATGRSIVETGRAVERYDAQRIGSTGSTYRVTGDIIGVPWTLADQQGRVLVRDRGRLHLDLLLDTKGSDDPGDDELLQFSAVSRTGEHPVFAMTEAEYCALVRPALAAPAAATRG